MRIVTDTYRRFSDGKQTPELVYEIVVNGNGKSWTINFLLEANGSIDDRAVGEGLKALGEKIMDDSPIPPPVQREGLTVDLMPSLTA